MKRKVYSRQMRKASEDKGGSRESTALPKVDVLIKRTSLTRRAHEQESSKAVVGETDGEQTNNPTDSADTVANANPSNLSTSSDHANPVSPALPANPVHPANLTNPASLADQVHSGEPVQPVHQVNIANSVNSANSTDPASLIHPSTESDRPLEYMYPTTTYNPAPKEVAYSTEYAPGSTYSPSYGSVTYTSLQAVGPVDEQAQVHTAPHETYVTQHWDQENSDRFYPWKYSDGFPLTSVPTEYNHPDTRAGAPRRTSAPSKGSRRRRKRLQTPVQRSAANMRERRRMCHLNVAFDMLKDRLPNVKDKKKLSRIQTLKAAIYYIQLLRDSLNIV